MIGDGGMMRAQWISSVICKLTNYYHYCFIFSAKQQNRPHISGVHLSRFNVGVHGETVRVNRPIRDKSTEVPSLFFSDASNGRLLWVAVSICGVRRQRGSEGGWR